jgi:Acyl-CoA reductase (LuxC)
MTLQDRIRVFADLGTFLKEEINNEEIELWVDSARHQNAWFTRENVKKSLNAITQEFLDEVKLKNFTDKYEFSKGEFNAKKIGVVMAGNLPAVGFHDLLCVVLAGHECVAKLSSQDTVLMRALITKLKEFNSEVKITISEQLKGVDALIATGSDNTSKHFEYYFRNVPHIIRKNRTSIAILNGSETTDELNNLGNDIFSYFGLGCRNVSKVYVPINYDFTKFFESIENYNQIIHQTKYLNNYEYNKSILLVNGVKHLDNGFLLVTQNEALVSPISILYFEEYSDNETITNIFEANHDKIQCVVGNEQIIKFGNAQAPTLYDFADGVDTMKFLESI